MAKIRTTKGLDIIVDDNKIEELSQFYWFIHNGYAEAWIKGENRKELMHRYLTNCPKGLVVDHINGNKLDNRLENLEIVALQENTKRYHNLKHGERNYIPMEERYKMMLEKRVKRGEYSKKRDFTEFDRDYAIKNGLLH